MVIYKMVIYNIVFVIILLLLIFVLYINKETFGNINDKKINDKKINDKKINDKKISDKKIIIIGNAPFDKGNDKGKLIDSFEKVVRFNSFKLDNFTKYLGTKTSEWVVSDTHCLLLKKMFIKQCKQMPNVKINIILPLVFKSNKQKLNQQIPQNILDRSNILIQDQDIIVDKKYNFGRRWPSTGILTIYYYLNLYEKIYITGFNHFDPKEKTIHYYENRKQIGHQHLLEKQIVDDLVKEGRIIRI
jgi:hypothetical protein